MAGVEDLVNLGNLITQVRGSSQTSRTSGGTTRETTRTEVSDAGVNELIRNILAGPGGVQDIGRAARGSGVYDSATEEMLLGNLYATAANQAELARAPTVRETTTPSTTTTTEIPGMGLGPMAGTLAATSLAAPAIDAISSGISNAGGLGGVLSSIFGGGGAEAASAATSAATGAGAAIPGGFMSQVATGGAGAATSAIPGVGGFLSGLSSGELSGEGLTASMLPMILTGNPMGAMVGAIGSVLGSMFGGSDGTVICTALMGRGLLDRKLYEAGHDYLYEMPEETRRGYHYWACSVADKIDVGHKGWTTICLPFAKGRTALLASDGTVLDHIRHPVGSLTKFVGEPICWTIGKVLIARERSYG